MPRWLRVLALNGGLVAAGVCALLWSMPSDSQSAKATRPVWIFYDSSATNAYRIATAIARVDGHVRYASSWLHAVSADVDPSRLRSVAGVTRIRPVGRLYAAASSASVIPMPMQQRDSTHYGRNYSALRDLGVPQAHGPKLLLTGSGIRIAIIDTGFETAHDAFAGARIVMQRDFINNDGNVRTEFGEPVGGRDQEVHGTWTWSVLGGNRAGELVGPAFGAEFILAKVDVEPVHGNDLAADEDRWLQAVEWAGDNGARVIVSALAYRDFVNKDDFVFSQLDGNTTRVSLAADRAAARDIVLVTAMGNTTGPASFGSLFAPADADSVISVGAVDQFGAVWGNSARGPTANSRVKPELVARGVNVWAANALNPNGYEPVTGTSISTALIGGIAALFREAWPEFNAAAVRDALILAGSNAASPPDNARGAGIPNVAAAILFPRGLTTSGITSELNGQLTTITPEFNWTFGSFVHERLRPVRFRVEFATDPQFNNIFRVDTISNAFSLTPRGPLRPTPFFWWRVVAEADAGAGVPIIRRATAASGPFGMPDWVTLTTMNDPGTAIVKTARPEFRWHALDAPPPNGPLQFDLQILTLRGDIVQNLPNLTDTIFTLPAAQQLTANSTYRWRVIARSATGVADTVNSRGSFLVDTDTDPPTTSLYPSFPNPFPRDDLGETSTHFWFDLADSTKVELTIHDLRGRLVKTLISATICPPLQKGEYGRGNEALTCGQTTWDGRNEDGALVPRGIYIARLRANSKVSTQRILYTPRQ